MERRAPSTLASSSSRDNIRRRSSAAHTTPPDILSRRSTVTLVSNAHAKVPLTPQLPPFACPNTATTSTNSSHYHRLPPGLGASHDPPIEDVPLTPRLSPPRPDPPRPSPPRHTRHENPSLVRLPTPDYPQPSSRSVLSRGFSFITFRSVTQQVNSFFTLSPATSKNDIRASRSRSSRSSKPSRASKPSSRAGSSSEHSALLPPTITTEKFTQKWPRPRPFRKGVEVTLAQVAEDGRGLGMNSVDKWTKYKWALLLSVITVFAYGIVGLVYAILTWFRTWMHADVMYVADNDVLILITLAASILILSALIGFTGALLNSRPLLAVYALLLWPALIALAAVGYASYKRATFALDRKLSLAWSQYYTPLGRLLIQNALHCCGFYNALHEATQSTRCFPRTPLPGCKGKLFRFERENLGTIWSVAFSIAALHLINIVVALLCANHVTDRFGKGITPKQYRLTGADVQENAEKIMTALTGNRGGVARPPISRASSSKAFRQDREENEPLLST